MVNSNQCKNFSVLDHQGNGTYGKEVVVWPVFFPMLIKYHMNISDSREPAPHDGTRLFRYPWEKIDRKTNKGQQRIAPIDTCIQYVLVQNTHPMQSHTKSINSTCLSDPGSYYLVRGTVPRSRRAGRQLGMHHSHRSISRPVSPTHASKQALHPSTIKRNRNRKQTQEMLVWPESNWHMHAYVYRCTHTETEAFKSSTNSKRDLHICISLSLALDLK